jgi:hypothetical protein
VPHCVIHNGGLRDDAERQHWKWFLDGVHATPPERHSSATSVGARDIIMMALVLAIGGMAKYTGGDSLAQLRVLTGAWYWQVPLLRLMQWAMMARPTPLRLRPESVRHHQPERSGCTTGSAGVSSSGEHCWLQRQRERWSRDESYVLMPWPVATKARWPWPRGAARGE